jgi:hypothetical protein
MTTSPDRITPAALAARLTSAEPHAVLDVRERGAYERGHVFRTTALPRRWLEFRLPALVPAPAEVYLAWEEALDPEGVSPIPLIPEPR